MKLRYTKVFMKDFKTRGMIKQEFTLLQPENQLVVKENYIENFGGIPIHYQDGKNEMFKNDSLIIKDVHVKVVNSTDSNYHVLLKRYSRGKDREQVIRNAQLIHYHLFQQDSILYLPDGFTLLHNGPYRSQRLLIKIFVPEAKKIFLSPWLKKHLLKHPEAVKQYHFKQEKKGEYIQT